MLLILEWVEKLFNEKIQSYKALAMFLIDKMYVDNRSIAAQTLMSSFKHFKTGNQGKSAELISMYPNKLIVINNVYRLRY